MLAFLGLNGWGKETLYGLTHHATYAEGQLLDEIVERGALSGSSSLQQVWSTDLATDQTPPTWPRLVRPYVLALVT